MFSRITLKRNEFFDLLNNSLCISNKIHIGLNAPIKHPLNVLTLLSSLLTKGTNLNLFIMEYISYNAGCNTWITELYDSSIDWHNEEFRSTKKRCDENNLIEMERANRSYNDDDYLIG